MSSLSGQLTIAIYGKRVKMAEEDESGAGGKQTMNFNKLMVVLPHLAAQERFNNASTGQTELAKKALDRDLMVDKSLHRNHSLIAT